MATNEYIKAARDLYLAYNTNADHFTAQLFRLMRKAAGSNFTRLCEAFPLEGEVFKEWYNGATEREFYDKYRVNERLPNCS